MRRQLFYLGLFIGPFLWGSSPNVLFICIDDLRPELRCYGVDYMETPNIDKLGSESRIFTRHYVQAPTCGASRYALLMGKYGPADNYGFFERAKALDGGERLIDPSLPQWFRNFGYATVSVGKVSHHPGGRGGADWDDETILELPQSWDRSRMPTGAWKHPRGAMHGLANGEIRSEEKKMAVFQSFDGPDSSYPDGLITEVALEEMNQLAKEGGPFFLAVGIIRPHLPFGAPKKYLLPYEDVELPPIAHPEKPEGVTTWHGSSEFMRYDQGGEDPRVNLDYEDEVRRHYAACVSYADAQVGYLLAELKKLKLDENTVVVLWGDHGWHLGEHGVWGKHTLFEESLRSPLMIHVPGMELGGEREDAVVETIDIFPTLCELAGLPKPDGIEGTSLVGPLSESAEASAIAYTSLAVTVRTDRYRLVVHKKGAVELYDHRLGDGESKNLAKTEPEVVDKLKRIIEERFPKGAIYLEENRKNAR